MVTRLVLGCGAIGSVIIERLSNWPGELVVIDDDRDRVTSLRESNIRAEHADPTDPGVLEAMELSVDLVLIATDDPAQSSAAVAASRQVYPSARLIVYSETPPAHEVSVVADKVIDPGSAVATRVSAILHEDADRFRALMRTLRSLDGPLGIFTHDNPDPDAIASAIALQRLADRVGLMVDVCYFGEISHQENRAFVNLLDLELTQLDADEFTEEMYGSIALVDHSRPGINNQLPPETPVDIVIDHHPARGPVHATFIDLRSDTGATSTLLVDHFKRGGIEVDTTVATALLYGIRVDTREFSREITVTDFSAAAFLLPSADIDLLRRIESPSITGDTFDTIARAIRNRQQRGSVVISNVGSINNRDALAQAADQLLTMNGITATAVYGVSSGTIYISARSYRSDVDIGEILRQAFDQIGSAGGHVDMAGAQIPLGILGDVEDHEAASLEAIVTDVITNRFYEVLEGSDVLESTSD